VSPFPIDEELLRLIRFFKRSKDEFAIGLARGPVGARRDEVLNRAATALAEAVIFGPEGDLFLRVRHYRRCAARSGNRSRRLVVLHGTVSDQSTGGG
jgi:hypothetical protein